jgi:AcrR family transcriptional regulator
MWSAMAEGDRPLRADAERNRRRLLDAARVLFSERGLEVGVAEIAQRAKVGRGTLFRNFATKEDLIAAVVVDRMADASARGRELLEGEDPTEALFEFLSDLVGRQQLDRALIQAVADEFLANPEIRAANDELVAVLDELLLHAQDAGGVRRDVGALDVLMLFKGVCEAMRSFQHLDPNVAERHLDLVRSALAPREHEQPLRGRIPTLDDLEPARAR